MSVKRIILDVDNTVAVSDTAFIKSIEKQLGMKPLGYVAKEWNFSDVLPNLDPSQIPLNFASQTFFDFLLPIDHVVEEITKCNEMGIKIAFCSHCSPNSMKRKANWLKEHFKFDFEIFFACKKDMDKSWMNMGEGDLFIDDNPLCLASVNSEYGLLFKNIEGRDWQKDYEGEILKTWEGFADLVKAVNEEDYDFINNYIEKVSNDKMITDVLDFEIIDNKTQTIMNK